MARRELARAVVVLDHLRSDGRTLSRRAGAADELLGSAGGQAAQKFSAQRRGADGALGTATKSLSRSRSVSSLFGTSDLISFDDLEVSSHPRRTATCPSPRTDLPSCAVTHSMPLLDACRPHRWSRRSASCSSATARWLPWLQWPRSSSSRTSAVGSAIDIALFAVAARHACGMRLRGSRGACLAYSHASRC